MAKAPAFRNRIIGSGEESPEQLVANPLNWRIHPKHQQEALEAVMDDVGWVSGVIVNRRSGFVVDGHLRVSLALRRGEKALPVQYVDLDEAEERLVLATLDPIAAMAATDRDKMASLLADIQTEDARTLDLLEQVARQTKTPYGSPPDDEEAVDEAEVLLEKWKVKPGDLWIAGEHRIICGDCLEVMREMPDGSVDAVVTDPPFFAPATHYQSRVSWGRSWGDMSLLGQCFFDWCEEWKRILKDDGHLLCFCNDESYPVFYPVAYGLWDFSAALIWDKGRVGLGKVFRHQFEMVLWASNRGAFADGGGKLHSDILRYAATPSAKRDHPVEKPAELLAELIEVCTRPAATVLDPFMGSGTTLVACERLGRKGRGIEIEPKYLAVALERLANLGLDPHLE